MKILTDTSKNILKEKISIGGIRYFSLLAICFVFAVFILMILSSFNVDGVWVATLTCKSESGKTVFNAELEECQTLINAEITIDTSKLFFSKQDDGYIVFDPGNKVFTLYLVSKKDINYSNKFLMFWAIPSSFEKVLDEEFHQVYKFKAVLRCTDPRNNKEINTPEIKVDCTLNYEL